MYLDGRREVDITATTARSQTHRFSITREFRTVRCWSWAVEGRFTSSALRRDSGQKEAARVSNDTGQCRCTPRCFSSSYHSGPHFSHRSGMHQSINQSIFFFILKPVHIKLTHHFAIDQKYFIIFYIDQLILWVKLALSW